ncbi:hypothetical protein RB195_016267 [Necator americanus]|uniref:Uncharacterized protein n=1 Tax=Necator americanus TaxID=51031 RepID=A0ABR1E8K6_NECAM
MPGSTPEAAAEEALFSLPWRHACVKLRELLFEAGMFVDAETNPRITGIEVTKLMGVVSSTLSRKIELEYLKIVPAG